MSGKTDSTDKDRMFAENRDVFERMVSRQEGHPSVTPLAQDRRAWIRHASPCWPDGLNPKERVIASTDPSKIEYIGPADGVGFEDAGVQHAGFYWMRHDAPEPLGADSKSVVVPPFRELVKRAVSNARPTKGGMHPRWVAVKEVFAVGSTTAQQICEVFDVNPDELLRGPYETCPDCGDQVMDENGVCPECS